MNRLITSYKRMHTDTGEIEELPFAAIDGQRYGVRFERGEGVVFTENVALQIVNRWNYINSLQPSLVPFRRSIYWIEC